jgi:hypothetical protein
MHAPPQPPLPGSLGATEAPLEFREGNIGFNIVRKVAESFGADALRPDERFFWRLLIDAHRSSVPEITARVGELQ